MKTLIALAVASVLLLAAPAAAHPTYQLCGHGRCTRPHRAHQRRCGRTLLLSPRGILSCDPDVIAAFPWNRGGPV